MQFLLNHCQIAFEQNSGILLTLFAAGLFGGLTHCAGMCGPFVAAQIRPGNSNISYIKKLSGIALLPYHFGRMTTYIFMGVIATLLSKQIIGSAVQQFLAVVFLFIAGVIFISSAAPKISFWQNIFTSAISSGVGNIIGGLAKPLFNNNNVVKRYILGVLLGFLPCGLIFAMLMIVSTTGSIFTAIIGISLFTIGTLPSMMFVGFGSQLAYNKWPNAMKTIARTIMVFNGISLFVMAGGMIYN